MWNINSLVLYCLSILLLGTLSTIEAKKMHYIHWNRANPMFRLDNTDHIVDVNNGNLPWEYDQVNIRLVGGNCVCNRLQHHRLAGTWWGNN